MIDVLLGAGVAVAALGVIAMAVAVLGQWVERVHYRRQSERQGR